VSGRRHADDRNVDTGEGMGTVVTNQIVSLRRVLYELDKEFFLRGVCGYAVGGASCLCFAG